MASRSFNQTSTSREEYAREGVRPAQASVFGGRAVRIAPALDYSIEVPEPSSGAQVLARAGVTRKATVK